jgi:uncharacterized protein YigE (DUF2233 family)
MVAARKLKIIGFCLIVIIPLITFFTIKKIREINTVVSYQVNPQKKQLQFYWKDNNGNAFKSISNLKSFIESKNQKLVFALNGGMYKKDNWPQGLFIDNFLEQSPIDTGIGNGNFYLKPNGVFYITHENIAAVCSSEKYDFTQKIKYATQSGPMLVIDGALHPAFIQGSKNVNIRNGVGILPNGNVVFAISKKEINFYDFALYFKNLGCKNALYLDGFVSRMYLPEKNWVQTDGDFGVIIGVVETAN